MTSLPPAKCCTTGFKHEGTAVGQYIKIGEIDAYVSYPPDRSPKKAIVYLSDVVGHKFINSQLIADQFASNGYVVVIPDLFEGDPLSLSPPPGFDIHQWLKVHSPKEIDPIVEKTLAWTRQQGADFVGAAGYCIGAKYVLHFLKQGQFDAGYITSPSWVSTEELNAITGPLSIAAAETDELFPPENRHESEVILKNLGVRYLLTVYSGVVHGFAVRCDLSDRKQRFAKEQSFVQAVTWFDEFSSSDVLK